MASQEFENAPTYQQIFANAWPNDFELIELLRKSQTKFSRNQVPCVGIDVINEATRSMRKIIRDKTPDLNNLDAPRNKLRRLALTILASDNAKFACQDQESYSSIPTELLQKVLIEDNDSNAEIALNILSLPAFTSRYFNPVNDMNIMQRLIDYCKDKVSGMHKVFGTIFQDITFYLQQVGISKDEPFHSIIPKMRLVPIICKLAIARLEVGDVSLIRGVAEVAWNEFSHFPSEKFLHAVKNGRIYREYLVNLGELLALLDLARQQRITVIEISQGQMADIQLRILLNLPPGTESLRLSILRELEKGLTGDQNNRPFQGIGGVGGENNIGPDGTRTQNHLANLQIDPTAALIDILGSIHLESVIDSSRMQGRGRPSAEIQLTHAAILRALGQRKVPFSNAQIQRVVRIICRSFLDNAVPLSQKSTLIFYLHGINVEYGRRKDKLPRSVQFEILASLAELCRIIRPQIEQTIKQIRKSEGQKREEENMIEGQEMISGVKFELAEKSLLEPSKPSSQSNVQNGLGLRDKTQDKINTRQGDISEAQRIAYSKVMWNCIASADLIFTIAREQRQQIEGGSGTFLEPNELKVVKRLLLHGSEVIQGVAELGPSNEGSKTVRFFADFFRRVRPLQLRDILNDVGPQLFARIVVAKTQQYLRFSQRNAASGNQNQSSPTQYEDQGIVSLVLGDFATFAQNRQAMEDEHVCTFLECAFDFVSNRLTKLSAPESPGPALSYEQPLEDELAALPKAELQEALVDLALLVGEQALKRPNDIRAKHIFFSVFVFCVKQAKNGALVADHYYVIIIRLFRDLCTAEHEGLVKEFLPMIQGLLETFLQSRDYVPYIEVTNHIFECVPAKLKSLLDYLPVISKPVVESMRTVAHRDLERPLNTLQLWVSGLGQFPEILDPAISHVLPELTGMLYKILYQLPNFPFKLLGKLGAKSRPYWQDQEVSTRRFSEGGLKLRLKDRHSGCEVVLGIDAAIEVVLVKIFENPRAYSLSRLLDAFRLVKAALLCYIDSDIDVDYLIARVVAAKSQGPQQLEHEILEAAKAFDSSRRHNHGSFLARGSEAHAFEKILRSLLFACSLPEDNPDTLKVGRKVLKFMKWVTQYFTLVYVCKDGQLLQSREDEVNPLKFLETISAFLLYNLRPGSSGPQQSSYFEGTVVCLETMLKLLNQLFGDTPEVLSNLEIVGILIKKVCHLAYEPDLRKKLAITFALPAVIRELPALAIRRHSEHILDSLSQILHTGCELSLPAARREYEDTLELLFSKIGFFGPDVINTANQADRDLFAVLIGKVFKNLNSLKTTAREIAASLIEKIATRALISVAELAEKVPYQIQQGQVISWRTNMWRDIETQASKILPCYRGGYTRLQKLIAYTDSLRFCLRHRIANGPIESKVHTLLGVSELLLKILEIEAHEFDESQRRTEPDPSPRRSPGVESPSSCAQKYMRLERLYISQNQEYDPYSHTQHPHELLSTQHFEVSYQAKREKEKRPDEALQQCSFRILEIFAVESSFDRINPLSNEVLSEPEKAKQKGDVETRSAAFLNDIFSGPGMGQRPSDINYDYVGQLYMLYPNVQLHTELICRCLEVLCDIVTHPGLDHYLQERQQAYYAPQPAPEAGTSIDNPARRGERSDRPGPSKLDTKLDFYAVEIKAKIIAIYFKYFQREEDNIIGTTKACLERLLSEAYLPAEALPNRILKEGVRPALNVLSQPTNSPRAFKHLTMLIEVLHGCFNDQLAQHLLAACQRRQQAVLAPYIGPDQQQQPLAGRPQEGAGQLNGGIPPLEIDPGSSLEQERRLVAQYNLEKVGSLETAKHIFQILHLLPNARERVLRSISNISKFELQASRELETSHVPPPHGTTQNCLELRPLRVRFGVLQSDFRDGLAKFFNRNPVDCVVKLSEPAMVPLMLAILKMPGSFTARERIARDIDITIRQRLRHAMRGDAPDSSGLEQATSLLAVRLVWILTKYNSNFLCLPQHSDILENLRWRWVTLSEPSKESSARNLYDTPEGNQRVKQIHRKILKCLLAYCRSEASDKQVLFDLLKGFSYDPIIDLTKLSPLLLFFTEEVPKFSRRRLAGIIESALTKVESSRGTHEQRYAMFEFAFMPLALSCLNQKERFEELFPANIIQLFLETFFGIYNGASPIGAQVKWRVIQSHLEGSSQICYESFFVELLKALSVVFLQVQDRDRFRACFIPFDEYPKQILAFMKEQASKALDSATREWACYSLTLFCLKALDFTQMILMDLPAISNQIIQGQSEQAQVLQLLSEANKSIQYLWPLVLRTNQKEMKYQDMVQKTVQNLISFWRQYSQMRQDLQEPSRYSFAEVFEKQTRDNPTDSDLCRMIIINAEVLTPFSQYLRPILCELIRSSVVAQNLQSCELIIKAAVSVVGWCTKDHLNRQFIDNDIELRLFRMITAHLIQLVQTNLLPNVKEFQPRDVELLLTDVLQTIRQMLQLHPIGLLTQNNINNDQLDWRDKPNVIRLFELNLSYLIVKNGNVEQDQHLLDYVLSSLQHIKSGESKCILMAIQIFQEVIKKLMDKNVVDERIIQLLYGKIKEFLNYDNETSQNRVLDQQNILSAERQDNQRIFDDSQSNQLRRWDRQAVQEAEEISRSIPHFSVRMSACLDSLAASTKSDSVIRKLREQLLDFTFCKKLVSILLRVVGKARRAVVTERPTFTFNDSQLQQNLQEEQNNGLIFIQDVMDWQKFEPELDHFNKESIMSGLKFLAKRTHAFRDEEAAQVLENLQWLPVALAQFRTCDYITEEVDELIDILIQEEPDQVRHLQAEKQQALVQRLLERLNESQERRPDRKRDTPAKVKLQNKLFESCIASLERQSSMSTDYQNKLMEQLLISSRGRSVALKQRLFTVFERCHGQSIYKKLKFFFTALQAESQARVASLFVISQLLDFTMMNFRSESKLEKLPHSAKLHRLSCPHILIERLSIQDPPQIQDQGSIRPCLTEFAEKQRKYMQMKLSDLLDPLSEVISINPTYHDDKPIADILFTELFWQLWAILTRQEQLYLGECICKMFQNAIKHSQTLQQLLKPTTTFARTMLESVAALTPQIRLPPELLQFMAKQLNLWHVAIPILENHIVLHPKNERYVMALGEVYSRLHEEDYLAGLRRSITESEETRTIVTLGQHGKWEAINQLFAQYIVFYAEQEGLYAHLDRHQDWPGKYSRQLPRQFLLSKFEASRPAAYGQMNQEQDQQTRAQREQMIAREYAELYEKPVQNQVAQEHFPREGPNNKVSEIDLRVWETLFIESLKVLNKWEQFRDIAHLHGNGDPGGAGDQNPGAHEMWIEFFWQKKDWENLGKYRATLMASPLIKYQLYYIYLIIQEHENQRFDDVFKKVIQLAHQEWETQLPNYVDRAQFESLIMFQQVVESSEGGRSMIREARHLGGNERLKELKAAMNIWRERVPHECESIKTWKEVLENRNFIYEQLCSFIQPQLNSAAAADPQIGGRVPGIGIGAGGAQQVPQVELLDICWNLVKLASISRKHGLPSLALYYQDAAEKRLSLSPQGIHDSLKYERYKHQLEVLKLDLAHNTEEPDVLEARVRNQYTRLTVEPSYDPWQKATFRRIIANYYLDQGKLRNAQDHLVIAISELNRRDPKLWMSYAKLNETIFERNRDEQSLINALKGLLFATTLSLYKSRLIMPRILRLLRQREHQNKEAITDYVKENTEHMPTWIWIFWAPQLLVMLQQPEKSTEHQLGRHLLGKLVTVYPQAAYYPLRANFTFCTGQAPGALRDLLRRLKARDPDVLHDIEMIGKEFNENIKPGPEESLCAWLQGLEIGTFFNRQDVHGSVQSFLQRLYDNYLDNNARSASPLLRALAPGYRADFLNGATREDCILKSLLRLKNLKDFLLYTINSREQSTHLEELSPCLAHFTRRAIEIPGQHVLSEDEPLPQRTVYLDRFEAFVQRSGLTQRKIVFKGTNSKSYPFSATPATDYSRICSEERATQLKVLMNMIFQRNKETLRRGVKFCVPSKLIMYLSKLSQDDLTFQEFQETHDFLLQEKGVDPDIALLLQIKWVRQLLDRAPLGQTRSLSQITHEEIKQLNTAYFEAMVGNTQNPDLCQDACFVPSSLLSSYFHRIFYNVDDLFLFKKRFTTYHAANSFFTYIFNQAEFQNLSSMSFCKSTGRLTFSEPRLRSCHKSPLVFINKTMDEVEAADFDSESRYMPFRLTSNIVDFIGTIGLQGLFAGVMTSCSLAISKSTEKLIYFLTLVLKDELVALQEIEDVDQVAAQNADYAIFKIKSLSNHSKVIDLPRSAADRLAEEELDESNPNQWVKIGNTQVPAFMMDLQVTKPDMPEEFNKKVFKLMELALDDSRRRQMLTMWCPWF